MNCTKTPCKSTPRALRGQGDGGGAGSNSGPAAFRSSERCGIDDATVGKQGIHAGPRQVSYRRLPSVGNPPETILILGLRFFLPFPAVVFGFFAPAAPEFIEMFVFGVVT